MTADDTLHRDASHGITKAITIKGKGKGSFYIAQYPVRWTAQSALHFLPSLTDLFIPTPFSASPGSMLREAIARKCPIFQTVAKGDSNPGSLDCESGIITVRLYCITPILSRGGNIREFGFCAKFSSREINIHL